MKQFKFLAMLLMTFSLSLVLTSCGDDGDDVLDETAIVGVWKAYLGDGEYGFTTFNWDGTYIDEFDEAGSHHKSEGTYVYDVENQWLTLTWTSGRGYTYTTEYKVELLTKNVLKIRMYIDEDEGFSDYLHVYQRVK